MSRDHLSGVYYHSVVGEAGVNPPLAQLWPAFVEPYSRSGRDLVQRTGKVYGKQVVAWPERYAFEASKLSNRQAFVTDQVIGQVLV